MPRPPDSLDGSVTPFSSATRETKEAMLDAVREANGRRAILPAQTVDAAALDVESWLVVPAWASGETAADVAAEMLRDVHGLDVHAGDGALAWALYAEAARRLGFCGPVPVPAQAFGGETAPAARA